MRVVPGCLAATLALATAACDDAVGPKGPRMETVCSQVPAYFAYRDDVSGWKRVLPNSDSTFVFQPQGKVAVVRVSTYEDLGVVFTDYTFATAAEIPTMVSRSSCVVREVPKVLTGTALHAPTDAVARVYVAGSLGLVAPDGSYTVPSVPYGPQDLVGVATTSVFGCGVSGTAVSRLIVKRDLDFEGSYPTFSFQADGQAPAQRTLTLSGLAGGETWQGTFGFRTRTTTAWLGRVCEASVASVPLQLVPASLLRADDSHVIYVSARGAAGTRTVSTSFREPTDVSLSLGPPLAVPTRTEIAPTPQARYRVDVPRQSEFPTWASVTFNTTDSDGARRHFVSMIMTAAYAENSSTWLFEMPEPPQGEGWNSSWGVFATEPTGCSAAANGGRIGPYFGEDEVAGETFISASRGC